MHVARFSVKQVVLMNLLFIVSILAGAFVLQDMTVDVFPNVSFAQATVRTDWIGASAHDVEQFVTRKIEEEIDEVQGIDRIVSHSQRDFSLIDVKFREDISDAQFDEYFNDLRAAVKRVTDLPDDAEEPDLDKLTVNEIYPMVQVIVSSSIEPEDDAARRRNELVLRAVAKELRQRLQEVDGVLRVSDLPLRDREVRVEIDPGKLRRHGLTLLDVHRAIQRNHVNLPGGPLDSSTGEVILRSVGEYAEGLQLLDLDVPTAGGPPVKLTDVAEIVPDFERRYTFTRYNGRQALNLGVMKREGQDSLTVKREIDEVVDAFRAEKLPEHVRVDMAIDATKIIESRIGVLKSSLFIGITLVFLLLWLFVGVRNSILAVIGIPFAFLLALCVLAPMGVTINAISLFSMVLVSGMVVDDAIIVIENIYRHVEMKKPFVDAIVDGTREVTMPVLAATLTTLAAFLPMLMTEGVVGEFMSIIPKTVAVCLAASLIECFLILPAHYLDFGPKKVTTSERFESRFDRIRERYVRGLRVAMRRPGLLLAGCLVVIAIAGAAARTLPVNLFPSDFQAFFVNLTLPPDHSLDQTGRAAREIEALLQDELDEGTVEGFTTSVGVTWTTDNQVLLRPNVAQLLVSASDEVTNEGDPDELIAKVRRRVGEYVKSGRSEFTFEKIEIDAFQDGPPIGKPVAVRVRGVDYVESEAVARKIAAALGAMPGVSGVSDNLDTGPQEFRLVPRRARLAALGAGFDDVALTARAANDGLVVGAIKDPDSDDFIDIRVELAPAADAEMAALEDAEVRLPGGELVSVRDLADVEIGRSYLSRYHYDTRRTVVVTADVDTAMTTSTEVNEALEKRFAGIAEEHPGVVLHFGGEFEETQKSFDSLFRAFLVALLLIYAILATQFRSYVIPIVVISAVPLAFVGVIFGLKILGFPFTIMTFIAIVGLAGIAVNDSLVLIQFILNAEREGLSRLDAIVAGCRARLRAIMLTTATTVFGLMPMALELTGKSKIWSPFAATLSSGLIIALFLTLFVVPAFYLVVANLRDRVRARFAAGDDLSTLSRNP